jgi:hypothetical protein
MPAHGARVVALVMTVSVVVPLMVGCGRPTQINDATLTTRVKTAILNDPAVGKLPIDVDTVNGVVTLSGRVATDAQRDRAVALARAVAGVIDVKHTLQVVPQAHRSPMPTPLARTTPGRLQVVPAA